MTSLLDKLRRDYLLATSYDTDTRLTKQRFAIKADLQVLTHRGWFILSFSAYRYQMGVHYGSAREALANGDVDLARSHLNRHTYCKLAYLIMEEMVREEEKTLQRVPVEEGRLSRDYP
jgi:hypothetical protein